MMKKVVNCYYVHKSNIHELLQILPDDEYKNDIVILYGFRNRYSSDPFEIIKYDIQKHMLSFIDSPDWNTANEPIVGDSVSWNLKTGRMTFRKCNINNPQIYHNKWMFVSDDYKGFDIVKAKERSDIWNRIPDIKQHKSRIGYKKYWIELLNKNGIEL